MSAFSRILRRAFSTVPTAETTAASNPIHSLSNSIYRERNLNRLAEKFKKCSENDRFRTNTGIYKNTIRRLAVAEHFESIRDILEDQKKYRDMSKEGFNARLINLYGIAGLYADARKVFDEIPERNCNRTVLSFNAILGACVNCKLYDMVDGLFKELPAKLGIQPDLVSYNTVVKAYCEMGSLDSAKSFLDEMQKKGMEPDLITFNTLLHFFYKNGRFVDGENIWGQMKESNVVPDIRSYNARLRGLTKEKKMKDAIELVDELKSKEVKLDAISVNALLEGFVNDGNLVEAKDWFGEMKKSIDYKPNKNILDTLLPLACDEDDFEFALELSKDIFHHKFIVDEALLQRVVGGLVKESKIDAAKKLVQLGRGNQFHHYKLKLPSNEKGGHNARLRGLTKEKKMKDAIELVDELKSKEVKLDTISVNALLEGFVNDGNLVEAKDWFGEMKKSIDYKPNKNILETLLPLACDEDDFEFALELSKDIFHDKFVVDEALLQRVVGGLVKESKIDAAKKLVQLGRGNQYHHYKLKLPSNE